MAAKIPEFKFCLAENVTDEKFLPTRSESADTGWDVRAACRVEFYPTAMIKIPLGIRCFAPKGYWLELRPRSSTFGKKQLHCLYGVIDERYEGELLFACQWIPQLSLSKDGNTLQEGWSPANSEPFVIEEGDRVGQLVPVKRQEMRVSLVSSDEFNQLVKERGGKRGSGGFGSTG